ncbi:MAG: F420-dependent methylenetetrahydromethanopterin dehydrogenase [Candidatus Heimdallarchaeota archaeon]|nr:F420-dependent methylenetetrahydromethanopterin dehydrogenase [Candidatus Heimdallarchaeota archaeon]
MTQKEGQQTRTKIGILKLGNIASSILLEMLLDERADRLDIDVKTVSSGAKLEEGSVLEAVEAFLTLKTELILVATPNASLANAQKAIEKVAKTGKPTIVITDTLKKKTQESFDNQGIGYLVVKADAMIGARREFLDPIEMTLYNSDILRILAIGGVFTIIYQEINKVVHQIQQGTKTILPQIEIDSESAVKTAGFANPYAEAKARGALEIAEQVGKLNLEACFRVNERFRYIPMVAMGHEMIHSAGKMADDAREIEKGENKVRRKPHSYEGDIQDKRLLTEKPR